MSLQCSYSVFHVCPSKLSKFLKNEFDINIDFNNMETSNDFIKKTISDKYYFKEFNKGKKKGLLEIKKIIKKPNKEYSDKIRKSEILIKNNRNNNFNSSYINEKDKNDDLNMFQFENRSIDEIKDDNFINNNLTLGKVINNNLCSSFIKNGEEIDDPQKKLFKDRKSTV